MKYLYVIVVMIALLPGRAFSCECKHPQSLNEGGWSYAFKGGVISVDRINENGRVKEIVTFQVLINITDVKRKKQKVLFRKGYEPCDKQEPNFKVGETYTITSMGNIETNLLYNNYCNLRKKH